MFQPESVVRSSRPPAARLPEAPLAPRTHLVAGGDTLVRVARQYRVAQHELIDANACLQAWVHAPLDARAYFVPEGTMLVIPEARSDGVRGPYEH